MMDLPNTHSNHSSAKDDPRRVWCMMDKAQNEELMIVLCKSCNLMVWTRCWYFTDKLVVLLHSREELILLGKWADRLVDWKKFMPRASPCLLVYNLAAATRGLRSPSVVVWWLTADTPPAWHTAGSRVSGFLVFGEWLTLTPHWVSFCAADTWHMTHTTVIVVPCCV